MSVWCNKGFAELTPFNLSQGVKISDVTTEEKEAGQVEGGANGSGSGTAAAGQANDGDGLNIEAQQQQSGSTNQPNTTVSISTIDAIRQLADLKVHVTVIEVEAADVDGNGSLSPGELNGW